jgi:GNAT superfamily N-acetyltransferase
LAKFDSREPTLDDWLRKRALRNAELAATRTYVICPTGSSQVVGYYAICMGQILDQEAVGSIGRNMPTRIPSVILARLAVDGAWQRQGLGRLLLADAVARSVRVSGEVSARLLVVHAISAAAETFYSANGFTRLPIQSPTYALDLVKFTRLYGK